MEGKVQRPRQDRAKRKTRSAKIGMAAILAVVIGAALAVSACGGKPAAQSSASGSAAQSSSASASTAEASSSEGAQDSSAKGVFTNRSTGLFPKTTWNSLYLNAGNRGCNSCHESLDTLCTIGIDTHPVAKSGNTSTHNVTITDGCLSCHHIHTADYGNYFADAIHSAHYSSTEFTDSDKGNCWSCHYVSDSAQLTDLGDYKFQLWEEVEYDSGLGGYPDTSSSVATRDFLKLVGNDTGVVTGMSTDSDASTQSVDMYQGVSDIDDAFVTLNHAATHGKDEMYDKSHTVTITGVKNPTTFTYDQLAAMPQTTVTATDQCVVAGSNGHDIFNATYSGVAISYLVDQCGGLVDGANQAYLTGWDEWTCCGLDQQMSNYVDHGIVALKMFDEDLPYEFGGPMCVVAPGVGGAFWCKFIKEIDFTAGEKPYDFVDSFADLIPGDELNYVSGAWFANDGITFTKDEGVELKGYAFAYAQSVAPLTAIEFSTDLGTTWTRYDVPSNMDPYQWVQFTFDWKPADTGTYIVKVRGVNANGSVNETDGSIIVTVTD